MQTDRWLISAEPEQEHLSPSAGPIGFPIWIDEEEDEEDVTRAPTVPPRTMWQHESPGYRAESSLSSLSLVAADDSPPAQRPPSIDELDTLPPMRRRQR